MSPLMYVIHYTGIHQFLTTSAPDLQMVFDSACGFWNVHSVLLHHVEDMVERITNLRSEARLLCKMKPEEVKESCMYTGTAWKWATSSQTLIITLLQLLYSIQQNCVPLSPPAF